MGTHFVRTLFAKCKSRILGERGLCKFFPLACQVERHELLQWFLLLYLQQIPLRSLISIIFPTGSLDPSPFCWSVPEQGRMMYVICHLILSHSGTFKAAFPLTGRSLFLRGIWHCFLSPAVSHQHRSVEQNRPCKQGGDALQKADLRNIWIFSVWSDELSYLKL